MPRHASLGGFYIPTTVAAALRSHDRGATQEFLEEGCCDPFGAGHDLVQTGDVHLQPTALQVEQPPTCRSVRQGQLDRLIHPPRTRRSNPGCGNVAGIWVSFHEPVLAGCS